MADIRPVSPASGPVDIDIRPPGSKSETLRAMAIAGLASGRSHIYGGLISDDSHAMGGVLRNMGVDVSIGAEPWIVIGSAGDLTEPTAPLDAQESGLTARITLAMAGSLDGSSVVVGSGRLPRRPMGGLVTALRQLGVSVRGEHLPIEIEGKGRLWGGSITVDITESTQHATALMIVAPTMTHPCSMRLVGSEGARGYLDMTARSMSAFGAVATPTLTGFDIENSGYVATDVVVEADASSSVYPLLAAAVTGGKTLVRGIPETTAHPDLRVLDVLKLMGCSVEHRDDEVLLVGPQRVRPVSVDMTSAPDGALAIAVAAAFASGTSVLTGLHSLREKESDRIDALSDGLSALGVASEATEDSLTIHGGSPQPGAVWSHGDHRVAMSFAVAGLAIPGVIIEQPSVVTKTWPGFWKELERWSDIDAIERPDS